MDQQMTTRRLVELKREKLVCMEQLVNLSGRLAESVKEERVDELQTILEQIQRVMDSVNHLDERISEPVNREDTGDSVGLAGEERRQWEETGQRIDELVALASEMHQENLAGMRELRDQTAVRLKSVREGKKGQFLYRGKYAHVEGVFLDKKR